MVVPNITPNTNNYYCTLQWGINTMLKLGNLKINFRLYQLKLYSICNGYYKYIRFKLIKNLKDYYYF